MTARTSAAIVFATALGSLAFLGSFSSARASESLAVSPMGCQAKAADRGKVDVSFNKGIFNNSTTAAARVFCPIEITAARGGSDTQRSAVVWVIDNNSSVDFSCSVVFTVNAGGSTGNISTFQLTKSLVSGNMIRYGVEQPGLSPLVGYD